MDVIRVEGGHDVTGEVRVEGAKNSALKLMAATIMASGTTTLTNVPNIADVHVMGKVLKNIGAKIEVVNEHELKIDTSGVDSWETPYHLVAQMRASTAVLGPLLSRFGKAVVAMPGGCNIGARKIDMHILGLEALGVEFKVDHGNIYASAPHGLVGDIFIIFDKTTKKKFSHDTHSPIARPYRAILPSQTEPRIPSYQSIPPGPGQSPGPAGAIGS